jgi:hypothetical protein
VLEWVCSKYRFPYFISKFSFVNISQPTVAYRWIHYFYNETAGVNFRRALLNMMMTLFYDKLSAGETVPTVTQAQDTNTVEINEASDDFMMIHVKQGRQNEQGKRTSGETELQKNH